MVAQLNLHTVVGEFSVNTEVPDFGSWDHSKLAEWAQAAELRMHYQQMHIQRLRLENRDLSLRLQQSGITTEDPWD